MQVRDLASAITEAANNSGQRFSIGTAPTFGTRKIPTLMPSLIDQVDAQALAFSSVDVTATGSAAVVAAGAAKPAAATVAITPRQIAKIAAYATINTENFWQSEEVVASVVATLFASIATEEDKVANSALQAATTDPTPVASWVAAISAGQAAVAAAGGSPNLVVVPSASWPALASEIAASTGLSTPSSDAILQFLGSRVVLSPEGLGAFVLDPAAAVRAVRDTGFLIDTSSGSTSNTVTVVTDQVASVFVQVPQLIAEIAVTAA